MGGGNAVDWRAYVQSHSLTDKQQKLADKIRKREARSTNLQRELDKIRVRRTLMQWCVYCSGHQLPDDL